MAKDFDERFARIEMGGKVYQVLKYETDPETGEDIPIDWDEEATRKLIEDAGN